MTKRIAKWDNARLLLIYCVVLGHIINYVRMDVDVMNRVYLFIYAFHMPAFIYMSGMFSRKAVKDKRYDKAFSFLLLYFLIKFSLFLTRIAIAKTAEFRLFSTVGIDWYAFAVFLFYLVMMFLQRYNKRYVIPMVIFFGCMAGYDLSLGGKMVLARATAFFPFFVLGFYTDPEALQRFGRKIWVKLIGLVLLIAAGWTAANRYDDLEWLIPILKGFAYRNLDEDMMNFGGLIRLGIYAVAILMTLSFLVLVPGFRGFWSKLGSRTMAVYAIHYNVITWLFSGMGLKKEMVKHMEEVQANTWMFVIAGIITIVLALKPFDWLVRLLTSPPLLRAETAEGGSAPSAPAGTGPEVQPNRSAEEKR